MPAGRKYEANAKNNPIKTGNATDDFLCILNIIKTLPQRKKANGQSVRIMLEESKLFGKNVNIIKNKFRA